MKAKNKRWLERHLNDNFVKKAQDQGYRARSAFKLEQIDKRDNLIRPGQLILDVGAAPGSWSQYASKKIAKNGRIIAVDRLAIKPIAENVVTIKGDITTDETVAQIDEALNNQKVDLVICDIAPDITGIHDADQANMENLLQLVLDLAYLKMKANASLLIKAFEGGHTIALRKQLKEHFKEVASRKPDASRKHSTEFYILCRQFKLSEQKAPADIG